MPPETWPLWTQIVTGSGLVAIAIIAITTLAIKTGRGMTTAAGWVRSIVIDAMTEVVREHAPSVQQVTEIVEAKTAPLHAELTINGGKSLKDQVTRIERQLDDHMEWSEREAVRVRSRLDQAEQDAQGGT